MADAARNPLTRQAGALPQVLRSWWAPRRVFAGLRGMPERTLIAVLMAAMLIFLVAQAPVNARLAHLEPAIPLGARMGGSALAVMFMMPLLAYGLAALVSWLSRPVRRPLVPADSRLALFWALLAVSPAMLLSGLVAGFIGPGVTLGVVHALTGAGFMVIWVAGMIELAGRT